MKSRIFFKSLSLFSLFALFILFSFIIYKIDNPSVVETPKETKKEEKTEPATNMITNPKMDLERVAFSDLPGFKKDNLAEAYPALVKSCEKILSSPQNRIKKKIYFEQACKAINNIKIPTDKTVRTVIEKYFEPYKVFDKNKEKNNDKGVFTGYYSASLKASYKKSEYYKYPIYRLPKNLVTVNMADFTDCNGHTKCTYTARINDKGKIVPYYSNEEIKKVLLNDEDVLLWGDNPVDVMILHIQGSGVAVLPDGKEVKINYAGNNGHNFIGIGWILKVMDLLGPKKGSMQDVREWLLKHKDEAEDLINRNPRHIFFKEALNNEGPIGSLGVELTPERSMAVDNSYIPLGVFIWLDTIGPDKEKLQKLVTAQDTGIAIKGIVRGDFYFGSGDKAFSRAGRMKSQGSYYLILPKEKLI